MSVLEAWFFKQAISSSPALFVQRVEGLCSAPFLAQWPACPALEPHSGLQALDLSNIFPSAQGTFREAPGAGHVEDCQLCHPGTFCGRTGLAKPQGLCSPGHHCGPGSNTSSPVSMDPHGPHGGKTGLSGVTEYPQEDGMKPLQKQS